MPFIKYLSQDFDLMPYTTVAENVGKFLSMFFRTEKERINELLEIVEMTEFADVKTKYLRGSNSAWL
jgi:ABC-type multidrug transport system ATPase subunit